MRATARLVLLGVSVLGCHGDSPGSQQQPQLIQRAASVRAKVLRATPANPKQVVLRGDDGVKEVAYACADRTSRLRDTVAMRVIADYSLRLVRAAARDRDTARIRTLSSLYARRDWTALEHVSVDQACVADRPLAPPALIFPHPMAQAPGFDLATADGSRRIVLAALRGRIVVIDFWSTWCAPCVRELPHLAELANTYSSRVVVVGVLFEDTSDRAREWLAQHPTGRMEHVLDPDSSVARAYHVQLVPEVFVLDTLGRVMRSQTNPRLRMLVDELRVYLEGRDHA